MNTPIKRSKRINFHYYSCCLCLAFSLNSCYSSKQQLYKPSIMSTADYNLLHHSARKKISLDTFNLTIREMQVVDSELLKKISNCEIESQAFFKKLGISNYWNAIHISNDSIKITATNSFSLFDTISLVSVNPNKVIKGGFLFRDNIYLVIEADKILQHFYAQFFAEKENSLTTPWYRLRYENIPADLLYKRHRISWKFGMENLINENPDPHIESAP